jgi:hypothetical protein
MPRWLRVVRGMIGTGLTFAVGVGVVTAAIAGAVWLGHGISTYMLMKITARISVVAFLLGVGFSGVLAIFARGVEFSRLSLKLVAGLGAGAGLAYFALISLNGIGVWTTSAAVTNLVLLTGMGATSAVATLLIARRARSALHTGGVPHGVGPGSDDVTRDRSTTAADPHNVER